MSSATKRCPSCGRDKRATAYHLDRHRPDGLYWCCKQCRRPRQAAAMAAWRRTHPGYQRAYDAEYRDRKRAQDRARYHADLDTARARKRAQAATFRQRHRDRVNREKRAAYARDAELERALARLRREARA